MSSVIDLDERNGLVDALFATHGYVDDKTGSRSYLALAETLYPLIADAVITSMEERESVAVYRRPTLLDAGFPDLVGPGNWSATDDPAMAEAVYGEADRLVWERVKAAPNGDVQRLVGLRLPGLVLCRTKANTRNAEAVYLTADKACLIEDYIGPMRKAALRVANRYGAHSALVGSRIPDLADWMEREYRKSMRTAIEAGRQLILPTLSSGNDESTDA